MSTYIFGHKNPDTDSVCSSIALSYLKNELGNDTHPYLLGNMSKETEFVLTYFGVNTPNILENVNIQVRDLNIEKVNGVSPTQSILSSYKLMENNNYKSLMILDDSKEISGVVTMKDIAMDLITGDFYNLDTSLDNILEALNGTVIVGNKNEFKGTIKIMAYGRKSVVGTIDNNSIIIVGDRYKVISHAIDVNVELIIITGGLQFPEDLLEKAKLNGVTVISVLTDTYTTAKLINQCNYIYTIMKTKNIIKFNQDTYFSEAKEEILSSSYRNYPIVDENNKFIGLISRRHLLNPGKKKCILVDHNEYVQSVNGLEEAEILEVIDHHKIGNISTNMPISFRNIPVGSTCTIVYNLYKEANIKPSSQMAGLLASGIISDTLFLKSPTTTDTDKKSLNELNDILCINLNNFSIEMFKAGTSLENITAKELFYKDFKEFYADQHKIGLSQIFTLDIDTLKQHQEEIIEFIEKIHSDKNFYLTLMLVTDIINEGSYLFYKANHKNLISTAFNVENIQGVYVSGVVSRKKQILPMVMDAINLLR